MAPPDLDDLLVRERFPGQAPTENAVIHDWLVARGAGFNRIDFNVRVGQGQIPNPDHLPGIQRSQRLSTQKRIDVVAWRGSTPVLIEAKERVTPGTLGQLRTYRQLYLEEHQEVDEVELLTIGRFSDPDTLRAMSAEGVDVLLYEP